MDRRKAMKIFAGVAAGSGAGIYTFSKVFKTEPRPEEQPVKLEYIPADSPWAYSPLDPEATGDLAYGHYQEGSCIYAILKSVLVQLADSFGEPYASFPYHMMKYGHGGIGGYGDKGKLNNTVGKMECSSCHTESFAHKILADPHYKLMNEK